MIAVLILIIIIVLFIFLMKRSTKNQKFDPVKENMKTQKKEPVKKETFEDKLLRLNIEIREQNISQKKDIEKVIDEIRETYPNLRQSYPDKEITWQTEKIATDFLPNIVRSYASLNKTEQQNQHDKFTESLNAISNELSKIKSLLTNINKGEFDIHAQEISVRFSNLLG